MTMYRQQFPQFDDVMFATDGGMETTLIFHDGFDLPLFAAFDLLKTQEGRDALRRYYRSYASIARAHQLGFIVESATWRASPEWGRRLGYSDEALADANRKAIALCSEIREEFVSDNVTTVISGCIGPRGDGYRIDTKMTESEAEEYHRTQVDILRETEADMLAAFTLTYPEEAIGVTRTAQNAGMPVAISFTVETDGRLPCGVTLQEAICQVDDETEAGPAYFMINCAHPAHFGHVLEEGGPWTERIRGLRANASKKSHAELDESEELDEGNPTELAGHYRELRNRLPHLSVVGGCCGTDHRHVESICRMCVG